MPEKTAGLDDTLTNVLGTASPHVVDVASAYATIAAQGQKATPYLVAAVTSETTSIDYKVNKQTTAAFGADVAADTIDALQQVTASGAPAPGRGPGSSDRAGKTGTSDEHKSVWFTGFVPSWSPRSACTATSTASRSRWTTSGPQRQRGRRQQPPAVDVAGLHEGRHPGHGGAAVPQAGRHRRQRCDDDQHAEHHHDEGTLDHDDHGTHDHDHDRPAAGDDTTTAPSTTTTTRTQGNPKPTTTTAPPNPGP